MKLTVAAIQMESRNGDYHGNRKRAGELIDLAVKKEARLIVLPELALAGYIYTDEIWKQAETLPGRTSQWLGERCAQHDVYIGTSIPESDGVDFYNTFILCGPGGQRWTHRKIEPAGFEAFFFRGAGPNPCVFETPIGKVGVVICFDASKTYSLRCLARNRPDILLNIYSCIMMPNFTARKYQQNWMDVYRLAPQKFAQHLNVPVVACNKTGDFLSPLPMGFGITYRARFIDRTSIVDRSGALLSEIDGGSGVALAKLEMGTAREAEDVEVPSGRWFLPVSHFTRFASGIIQKMGMIRYASSGKRRKAASEVFGRD